MSSSNTAVAVILLTVLMLCNHIYILNAYTVHEQKVILCISAGEDIQRDPMG